MEATTECAADPRGHVELIDGWLWSDGPQQCFHGVMTDLLTTGLRGAAPPALRVRRQMTVVIDEHHAPEPDVMVVRAAAVRGADQMHLLVRAARRRGGLSGVRGAGP